MNIQLWLQEKIAEETDLPINEILFDVEFTDFNMDSLAILTITFDLESILNIEEIDPSIFTEYNTINKLTTWIENHQK